MSLPGRRKGECRRALPEGTPVGPMGKRPQDPSPGPRGESAPVDLHQPLRDFLRAAGDATLAEALLGRGAAHIEHYERSSIAARAAAVRSAFPTVGLLLGDAGFAALARGFARDTPARHWDLNAYGSELPGWIARRQPDADGAELADVARLDWAMHRAAFADDRPPLDRAALAAVGAARQEHLRLHAHPATALLASACPLASLWQSARDETLAVPAGTAETVLVGRGPDHRVWMRRLRAGEAAFMAAALAGAGLVAALSAAVAADATFDLAASLPQQLDDQVWSGFSAAA